MSVGLIVLIIVIAVVVILLLWLAGSYNGFVKGKNAIEEAFSTMDVYLKKRFDLIPNLVETVKGYATHEKETLEKTIAMRNAAGNARDFNERVQSESALSGAVRNLFAIAENYPDLKANQNFLNLQTQLRACEDDIANSRKYYNAVVKQFNDKVLMFPSSIVARMFNFVKQPMFEVADTAERENVKVQF